MIGGSREGLNGHKDKGPCFDRAGLHAYWPTCGVIFGCRVRFAVKISLDLSLDGKVSTEKSAARKYLVRTPDAATGKLDQLPSHDCMIGGPQL